MNDVLKIKIPPPVTVRLIAVAEELLKKPIREYNQLKDDSGNVYDILLYYIIQKDLAFPQGWLFLATGQYLSEKMIWEAYRKSERIILFMVQEVN